jgi:hypothetical protein
MQEKGVAKKELRSITSKGIRPPSKDDHQSQSIDKSDAPIKSNAATHSGPFRTVLREAVEISLKGLLKLIDSGI